MVGAPVEGEPPAMADETAGTIRVATNGVAGGCRELLDLALGLLVLTCCMGRHMMSPWGGP